MCVEVPHLRYVVAAADHASFRRAAAALNITQPTLSKRIRELEAKLGVLMFERSTGGARIDTPLVKSLLFLLAASFQNWKRWKSARRPENAVTPAG